MLASVWFRSAGLRAAERRRLPPTICVSMPLNLSWPPGPRPHRASGDGDLRGGALLGLHAFGDPHGLLDQGLHDLRLRHGLDDLPLDEDLALAVARGDAEVGLARLAGAVDDTPHDGHAQRDLEALEPGGPLLG